MLNRAGLPLLKRLYRIFDFKNRINNEKGFTLVEIVLGIVVLSIIITSVFRLLVFSSVQNRRTNDLDELGSVAVRAMEYLKIDNDGYIIKASPNYKVLTEYTADTYTQNRFTVAYKATEVTFANPGAGSLPVEYKEPKSFKIELEVYFTRDSTRLGSLDSNSKADKAHSLNIPIVSLPSQLIQYSNLD